MSRTFASGEECFTYFHELLTRLTHDQDLNEVLQQLPRLAHCKPLTHAGCLGGLYDAAGSLYMLQATL
jgi:hypothetical protein